MSKLSILQIPVLWSNDVICFVNDTIFGLSISYLAAYIVYVLTVLQPKSEQMKPILTIMNKQICNAIDEMVDLFNIICGISNIHDKEEFFKGLSLEKAGETCDAYKIKLEKGMYITQKLRHVTENLQYSLVKIEYLDSIDIDRLSRFCSISTNLITKIEDGMLLSKDQIEDMRKDIISLYTCLQNIEDNISFMLNTNKEKSYE